MPGGYKQIRPSDNPKPYSKNYNRNDFLKWDEESIHNVLDQLEDWLLEENEIIDKDGNVIRIQDSGNCFYKEFLYKNNLMDGWIRYVKNRYTSVKKRFKDIDKIQEHRLQLLAAKGIHKERITSLILMSKYKWRERSDNKNENKNKTIIWNETKTYSDKKSDISKDGDDFDFDL